MDPTDQRSAALPATTSWPDPGQPEVPAPVRPNQAKRHRSVEDKHSRSLLKAISWRITGTLDTILISFIITGKVKLAVSIGFVEVFTKIGLFYLHERVWTRIPLGRHRQPEDYSI